MAAPFVDRQLQCVECSAEFTFSAGEQEHHAKLGFTNEPKRCAPCRAARKKQGGSRKSDDRGHSVPRELFTTKCAECGQAAQVPFKPRGDRPIYCSSCFEKR